MSINIANNLPTPAPVVPTSVRDSTQRPAENEKADAPATDKVTLGNQEAETTTYADPRSTAQMRTDVASMLEESNRKVQEIINLILPLMRQQGLELGKVVSGEQQLSTDPATIEKAKAAIGEDGEFGVRQVAERILNFAKSVTGGDPEKLAAIRAGVEKGFKEATEMLGGSLPEISQKTYAAIMEEFDRWQTAGIPAGDVSLAPKEETAVEQA